MAIVITALAVSVIALILAIVALVKSSGAQEEIARLKRSSSELSDTLKQRLESLAKSIGSRDNPFNGSGTRAQPAPQQKAAPPPAPKPPPAEEPAEEPERFINFDCTQCGQNIDAPAAMAGFHANCPTCNTFMTVPMSSTGRRPAPKPELDDGAGYVDGSSDEEEVLKGATVRIDISKVFEEMEPPKRQIVIKRRT